MLKVDVKRRRDMRGVTWYEASIRDFAGTGPTRKEAEAELRSRIEGHSQPVMFSTSDGAVWVLYNWGGWWQYRICRPTPEGNVEGGTCSCGTSREQAFATMTRHMQEYETGLAA